MKDKLINELRKGLIAWYGFRPDARVLYVGHDEDEYSGFIVDLVKDVRIVSGEEISDRTFLEENRGSFDYIVCLKLPQSIDELTKIFGMWSALLKNDGICILAVNNRLGIRYFCGDQLSGSAYSKAEITDHLIAAGFIKHKFYSVFSNLDNPTHIFADTYKPNEDIANRLFPAYDSPETVFLNEEELYRDLIDNDIFHSMANGFLIEASKSEDTCFSDVLQVTSSMDRNPEDAFLTIVYGDGKVIKKNAYPEGAGRFKYMREYAADLKDRGIETVDMDITEEGLVMPYVDAPTGQLALKEAMLSDKDIFLEMLDAFKDCIMRSSEIELDDVNLGPIVRYGYIDMVPLNSFYVDGKYVFFDQEFRLEHYPVNAIIARMIATLYFGNDRLNYIIPREDLYRRYGILENRDKLFKMEMEFLDPLRNEEVLSDYHNRIRRNNELTKRNRMRMELSADRYHAVFSEVFAGCEVNDVYIFGSGRYAERFLDWYGPVLDIKGILDNDETRWGKCLRGIEIFSPEILKDKTANSYKVIICIKDHIPVIHQLDGMNVEDYSVYDGRTVYPRKLRGYGRGAVDQDNALRNDEYEHENGQTAEETDVRKPYHIGYISGTFDLFHKGHLNLLKRAKERCDYLIVGVVTDEGVRKYKHVEPFIPFEERREIVASCKYVDEANAIPIDHRNIKSAYSLYHFDCQFCGSDYLDDPVFMNDKIWLEERGSELEILPYTECTSSSKIKKLIESKLLD